MVVSIVLMLGDPAADAAATAHAAVHPGAHRVGDCSSPSAGTWATPNLIPLTALLMLVPLLVGFPYVSRGGGSTR